jgi:hypothetical protein
MSIPDLSRYVLTSCVAAVLLAGCGGSRSPIGATGAMPETSAITTHANRGESWMLPGTAAVKKLIYVSDPFEGTVHIYNYATGTLVGKLTGFANPRGQCVDGRGDVFIVDLAFLDVVEYEHGGRSPIKKLNTLGASTTCSVSPGGNLAVANYITNSGGGDVVIFKNASGNGIAYSNKSCYYLQAAGYDGKGNLYVQAFSYGSKATICELPKAGKTMKVVTSNAHLTYPDGVMWDGQNLTLTDSFAGSGHETIIYRMKESASGNLTQSGKVVLDAYSCNSGAKVSQPFIVGSVNTPLNKRLATAVVGPLTEGDCGFGFWSYPRGASTTKTIKVATPDYFQAVSIAP